MTDCNKMVSNNVCSISITLPLLLSLLGLNSHFGVFVLIFFAMAKATKLRTEEKATNTGTIGDSQEAQTAVAQAT